jgi:hypothetical protein
VPPAALTGLQEAGIVVGAVTAVGVLIFAAVNAWLAVANERKRTQPIVMVNQVGGRRFVEGSKRFAVDVFLRNEGTGAAFNLRFGVEFHGVRIPYKHDSGDHHAGSVHRVLGSGGRLPETGSWPLEIDQLFFLSKLSDPDATRVFWARYENAQGRLWETRNPGDRSKNLGIKRIRWRRLRERWEEHKRKRAVRRAAKNEQKTVDGLLAQQPAETPEAPQDPPLAS